LPVLIQYVDDLLLVSKTKENCILDTKYLCCQLVQKGLRVSPSKLQFCQTKVKYLGFLLSPGKREIDPERVKIIQELPRPTTKKQLRGFLGQAGFCTPWIPGLSEITKLLHEATRNEEVEPVAWGSEREKAFRNALLNAPALGLPDYTKPFKLYCDEVKGTARGILVQTLGPHERPVAYFSTTLDPVVKGAPFCIRRLEATAEIVEKSWSIVLGHALTVCVPHEVEILFTPKSTLL